MYWFRVVALLAMLDCAAANAGPSFDEVTSSCQGGFTGGAYGVTVHRDGRIVRWHTPSFRQDPEEVPMQADPKLATELLEEIDRIGFAAIEHDEKGNMTCTLTARKGEESHTVSWPHGRNAVPAVREIAVRIQSLIAEPSDDGQ